MTTEILVADDHQLIREGIVQIIEQRAGYEVVAQARDGAEALELIKTLRPSIAVLDISMPRMTGIELLQVIREENLKVAPVLLTMHPDEEFLEVALEQGVYGYILKENSADDLLKAIDYATQKKVFVSPLISDHLMNQQRKRVDFNRESGGMTLLSPAEIRILKLLADKKTSKQIAEEIYVSVRTVQNHRANICQKLGRSGPNSLLHFAIENRKRLDDL